MPTENSQNDLNHPRIKREQSKAANSFSSFWLVIIVSVFAILLAILVIEIFDSTHREGNLFEASRSAQGQTLNVTLPQRIYSANDVQQYPVRVRLVQSRSPQSSQMPPSTMISLSVAGPKLRLLDERQHPLPSSYTYTVTVPLTTTTLSAQNPLDDRLFYVESYPLRTRLNDPLIRVGWVQYDVDNISAPPELVVSGGSPERLWRIWLRNFVTSSTVWFIGAFLGFSGLIWSIYSGNRQRQEARHEVYERQLLDGLEKIHEYLDARPLRAVRTLNQLKMFAVKPQPKDDNNNEDSDDHEDADNHVKNSFPHFYRYAQEIVTELIRSPQFPGNMIHELGVELHKLQESLQEKALDKAVAKLIGEIVSVFDFVSDHDDPTRNLKPEVHDKLVALEFWFDSLSNRCEKQLSCPSGYDEAIRNVFQIWDACYEDGIEFCRFAFQRILHYQDGCQVDMDDVLFEEFNNRSRRRLLRDDVLPWSDFLKKWGVPDDYVWTSPYPCTESVQHHKIRSWIKKARFHTNPFGPASFEYDCLRLEIPHNPDRYWEEMKVRKQQSIIIGDYGIDRKAIALQLLSEYQESSFSILATLPFSRRAMKEKSDPDLDLFHFLGHVTAQAWFDLIGDNPHAYIELNAAEQRLLTEMLIWQAGSLEAALTKLEQSNMKLQEIQTSVQRRVLHRTIRSQSEHVGPIGQLSIIKIIDWMSLRPPAWNPQPDAAGQSSQIQRRMTTIYVILAYWPEKMHNNEVAAIDALYHYLDRLAADGIFVKLLIPLAYYDVAWGDYEIELRWSDNDLKRILTDRLRTASSSPHTSISNFDELFRSPFDPPKSSPRDYQKEMIQHANGSLARMLMLGNMAIRKHIELSDGDPPAALSEEAWDAALKEFKSP